MKKSILTVSLILLLAGCSNTPSKKEILESEKIILEEGGINPVIVSEEQSEIEKNNIFIEEGFERLDQKSITKSEKNNIIENNTIYFSFDSNELSKESKEILIKHVDFMNKNNMIKIIVEGHTDKRGEKSYNLLLGERRAKAVKDYFVKKGINENRIEVVSFGENKPLLDKNTEEAHKKNRRSLIIY